MTIQELGSLGELIAALATIATLVYLAFQIRQNTRALVHAEHRAILEDGNRWRAHLIEDPTVAELYRKGLVEPDTLDPTERLQFRLLLDALFVTWLYNFQRNRDTGYRPEPHITGTLARPGGRRYWEDQKANFDPEFVRYVDGLADDPTV